MSEPTLILSQAQIDFFHREGYLALPALTTAEEVVKLQEIYDHLFSSKAGRDQGDHLDLVTADDDSAEEMLPQILNPSKYAPELTDTLFRINATAIAKQLLGADAKFTGDHAIRKAPHSGVETPWHQDEAYWNPEKEYNALSIWIPLQEATLKNGCMQFIPGSQDQDVLPHHPIGNDPAVIGLEVDDAEGRAQRAVACELPAGGATIHHSRTLHYTGVNGSDQPRRAYILAFGTPAKQRDQVRDFYWLTQQKTKWQERSDAAKKTM